MQYTTSFMGFPGRESCTARNRHSNRYTALYWRLN